MEKISEITINCPRCGNPLKIELKEGESECKKCGIKVKTFPAPPDGDLDLLNDKKLLSISELSFLAMKFMKMLGLLEDFKRYIQEEEEFKEDLFFLMALITSFEISEQINEEVNKE